MLEVKRRDPLLESVVYLEIGDDFVADRIKRILFEVFEDTNIVVSSNARNSILWNRDLQVVLPFDGSHLYPSWTGRTCGSIEADKVLEIAKRMFPRSIKSPFKLGRGISDSRFSSSIPTCIEGGNCKFWEIGGRFGAFVGVSSVFLTIEEMLRTGFLTEMQKDIAMWDIAVGVMARELKIDPKNLIILEHDLLHIDLHLCVGPDNKIFLFDPRIQLEVLLKYDSEYPLQAASKLREMIDAGVFERNKGILEKEGFEVVGVPGYYDSGRDGGGEFLNGFLFRDQTGSFIFFSKAISSVFRCKEGKAHEMYDIREGLLPLAEEFSRSMEIHGIKVIYIDSGSGVGGGILCLTREDRSRWNAPPQYIPVNGSFLNRGIPTDLLFILRDSDREDLIRSVEVCFYNSIGQEEQRQELFWEDNSRSFVEVYVPWNGLSYTLLHRGEALLERRRVLPGHGQQIKVSLPLLAKRFKS